MWTKRSHFLYLKIKVTKIGITLVIPLNIFWELIEAAEDVIMVFGRLFKVLAAAKMIRKVYDTVYLMSEYKDFDFVDVEAENEAKIKIGMR